MEETTFFDQGGVKVTNSRFIVQGQTYAMNGVTSVKNGETSPSRTGSIVAVVIGIATTAAGSMWGLIFIIGAIFWWVKQKPTYHILLSSASGENEALSGQDSAYIKGVIAALNDALVHRG